MGKERLVADAGPLMALARLGLIPKLNHIFDQVLVPDSVVLEVTVKPELPGALEIQAALNQGLLLQVESSANFNPRVEELLNHLDLGEASVIDLCLKVGAIALIDEKRGRRIAKSKGVKVVGTAAILIKLKQLNVIPEVRPMLNILMTSGYRFSEKLVDEVLLICGE